MKRYADCPQVLREFLIYHENIKGQSPLTISEYYLDLRMFLRFIKLMRCDMPIQTSLDEIDIRDVDLNFIRTIDTTDIFDFLSYLANDRVPRNDVPSPEHGISSSARARKLSAIKSFYKYLTVRTKQLEDNPVADLEYPKLRKSLPKYLTLEQSSALLKAVSGPNAKRDYAILMLFLNCGIRRSELVGLNLTDVYEDRIRVVAKETRNGLFTLAQPAGRPSTHTYRSGIKKYCLIIVRCLAPGTITESVSLPSIAWSKRRYFRPDWIQPNSQPINSVIPPLP